MENNRCGLPIGGFINMNGRYEYIVAIIKTPEDCVNGKEWKGQIN